MTRRQISNRNMWFECSQSSHRCHKMYRRAPLNNWRHDDDSIKLCINRQKTVDMLAMMCVQLYTVRIQCTQCVPYRRHGHHSSSHIRRKSIFFLSSFFRSGNKSGARIQFCWNILSKMKSFSAYIFQISATETFVCYASKLIPSASPPKRYIRRFEHFANCGLNQSTESRLICPEGEIR